MTSDTPKPAKTAKTAKTRVSRTTKAAAHSVKGSALDAYRTVETMPKSQQKMMARTSLGVGAVLFILGAPRLLTLLAFLPAVAVAGMRLARRAA